MSDPIAFLHKKAAEIRAFANAAPELTTELRQLADLVEEKADDLAQSLGGQPARG